MADRHDEDWLRRLRAGEHGAFEQLVRAHHDAVTRLARRLLGNAEDARETVQEVFLAAYEGIGRFEGRSTVRTWLLAIAWRKAADRLRGQERPGQGPVADLDEDALWRAAQDVEHFTDWPADPEQTFRREEIARHLEAALARLPATSRAVFELRDLQGLTVRETADVLELSEGAVRVRQHRARQWLLRELQGLLGPTGGRP